MSRFLLTAMPFTGHVVLVTPGTQNIAPSDLLRAARQALDGRDVVVVATTGIPGRDSLPPRPQQTSSRHPHGRERVRAVSSVRCARVEA